MKVFGIDFEQSKWPLLHTDARTKSSRAGLSFPVLNVHRSLKKGHFANRIQMTASVYLSAVLEYMAAEVLELSGECAYKHQRKRIIPRHILLAVKQDQELSLLLKDAILSEGGVTPHIEYVLLQKKTTMKSSRMSAAPAADHTEIYKDSEEF